jgi:hypothetical protein
MPNGLMLFIAKQCTLLGTLEHGGEVELVHVRFQFKQMSSRFLCKQISVVVIIPVVVLQVVVLQVVMLQFIVLRTVVL